MDRNEQSWETFSGLTLMEDAHTHTHTHTELWSSVVRQEVLWSALPLLLNHSRGDSAGVSLLQNEK